MTTLITIRELRAQVQSGLDDTTLGAILAREEAIMVQHCGPHYSSDVKITTVLPGRTKNLYLPRRISSVYRVTEDGMVLSNANGDFRIWPDEGRLERLPEGSFWGALITTLWIPINDTELRKAVLIDLVRLALERTAMRGENIAGEYSFTAPDWELARAQLLRQLMFQVI